MQLMMLNKLQRQKFSWLQEHLCHTIRRFYFSEKVDANEIWTMRQLLKWKK